MSAKKVAGRAQTPEALADAETAGEGTGSDKDTA